MAPLQSGVCIPLVSPAFFPGSQTLYSILPMKSLSYWIRLATSVLCTALAARASQYDQRLGALATRGVVGAGDNVMISGFSVGDGAPKVILLRALGPRLATAPYSITSGTLADPLLQVYDSNGTMVLQNDNWSTDDATNITNTTAAVGLVALTANSKDAAIVATLSPGNYTAIVRASGTTAANGIALLEVYDVTGSGRLMALSTRAVVGSGANILISGLVVASAPGTDKRHLLVRASGPGLAGIAGLAAGTAFVADPIFSIYNGSTVVGGNDNWEDNNANANGAMSAAFASAGAFAFKSGSKDAAAVIDLAPGGYTIQVASNNNGASGLALVEVYDLTAEKISTVSVSATVSATDTTGKTPGLFTLARTGDVSKALTVSYTIGGTAVSGIDYTPLPGSVTFPAGVTTATVTITPKPNALNINNRTAILSLVTNASSYGIGSVDTASVTIFYNPGSLYVANLRPASGAVGSSAYGTATLQLSPDQTSATINVSFSNLSSPEVVAHLFINGNYVFNLPQGQVTGATWTFTPTGTYSMADLIAALKAGQISVGIDSGTYPAGELTGGLTLSSGAAAFNAPAGVPGVNLTTVGSSDAARFLSQATFGATQADINTVVAGGITSWINAQMALPATSHRALTLADFTQYTQSTTTTLPTGADRQAAWWKAAITAPDQLRQRVAFALSEILVISDQNSTVNTWQEGTANYYDVLVNGSFGNFRALLENVTLNPMMGIYLSALRSGKGTFDAKGNVLTSADENYAREVMQLFTIGLNQLQPDGTLQLDPTGQPIPTYNQATVSQTAKVFTGWAYAYPSTTTTPNFRGGTADYINPMMLFPAFHDTTAKTVVGGVTIPAGQDGTKDLKDMLDILFNHPNTPPFISRQLIQRLVTSNPSPGYIYRVAQVFTNNGAGVRGDLAAVVRAILTDYEARSPSFISTAGYGKLKEPLLQATSVLRAFGGASNSGRYNISNPETNLAEASLRAVTVFNFFQPDFVLPGALASAGLFAPEFQILTDTTAITVPNFLYSYIYNTRSTTDQTQQTIGLTLDSQVAIAKTPQTLVDQLNLVLTGGALSKATSDRVVSAITAMPTGTTASDTERVRSAIYLVETSPDGAIQK